MEKIKTFITSEQGKDILIVLIVILVGLGSFELGRLSKNDSSPKTAYPSEDTQQDDTTNTTGNATQTSATFSNTNSAGKNFFASSRGSKYYSLNCSAGKTIKQENRVYFGTQAEAERAGYTLSSSC